MPWFVYALLTALLFGLSEVVEKKVLTKIHSLSFSSAYSVINFVLSLPLLFFINFSTINQHALILMVSTAALSAVAFRLVAKGLRHLELSTASPLMALNPGAAALAGFVFLGERMTPKDILGIALIIVGSYVLAVGSKMKVWASLKKFFKSKYVIFILISVVLYALSASIDRTLMSTTDLDPFAFIFFVNLFSAFFFMLAATGWGRGVRGIGEALRVDGDKIVVISLFTISSMFFELKALSLAFVGFVSTIKRTGTLFDTLIGGEMFHEDRLVRKSIASTLIIIGCAFIVL
jgi:uncharacterized membrane protein